jgi:small subunit ribosomal protein S7
MVDAVDNLKLICKVAKVRVTITIYDVPGIVVRDRQQTLAIVGSYKQLSNDI